MSADINLLPQRKTNILRSERTVFRVQVAAVICVVALLISQISIFFINLANSPAALKEQSDALTTSLLQNKAKAIGELNLIDRLEHVQTILNNRASLQNTIVVIEQQIPSDAQIQTFTLDSKTMSLTVNTQNLQTVDTVISNMRNLLSKQSVIKRLTVDNVGVNEATGLYVVSMDASL